MGEEEESCSGRAQEEEMVDEDLAHSMQTHTRSDFFRSGFRFFCAVNQRRHRDVAHLLVARSPRVVSLPLVQGSSP